MPRRRVVEKAQNLYSKGDLQGAETLLKETLNRKPKQKWYTIFAGEYLWLGYIQEKRGLKQDARRIYQELIDAEQTRLIVRARAMTCLAQNLNSEGDIEGSHQWLKRAGELLEQSQRSSRSTDHDKAMAQFLSTRSLILYSQERFEEALSGWGRCHEYMSSINASEDFSKHFVTNYLNIFNCHLALGNIPLAKEYLLLARAKLLSLDKPYAHGLVHFFENLATFNLFAAGSTQQTIDSLLQISEKVVNEFDEFRRVFDFFSSLIVQLHDGKIDVGEIREQIKAYGDDPLIKAYIPTLLYGAPPPGSDEADEGILPARPGD